MKKFLSCLFLLAASLRIFAAEPPVDIYSGLQGKNHIQGIAVDMQKGEVYMSFTTSFVKTDLQGRLIGSLTGITGHLGCMTLNPQDGRIYASLEYKHDSIGSGIMKTLGVSNDAEDGFYIAIIDPSKVTEPLQPAESAMVTVEVKEALKDFQGSGLAEHKYGCSGIDGVTFAPAFGRKSGKMYLYVAYGIYSDLNRTDNDYQVILQYDVKGWAEKYGRNLSPEKLHRSGPAKPRGKYFVFTGNTSWGLQGMCYDPDAYAIFLCAYSGQKPQYPNWNLFRLDCSAKPSRQVLRGMDGAQGKVMPLLQEGNCEDDIYGWKFKYGTTGMANLGDGLWYISENGRDKERGLEYSHIHLYRWVGDSTGFVRQ